MPRIDLYLIKEPHFSEQIAFCCRLIEKAYQHHSRIHIQTQDAIQNEALDNALWSFKSDSFIPHSVIDNTSTPPQERPDPITIDSNDLRDSLLSSDSLLVLIDKQLPNNYQSYQRICLVIPNIEIEIQAARQLYKEFKARGNEVHIHDMRSK